MLTQGKPMRIWRKGTLVVLAALAVLALLLAGCAGNGDESSGTQPPTTTSTATSVTSSTVSSVVQELPEDIVDLFLPIEVASLGALKLDETLDPPDYLADDDFDRCQVYTAEMLTTLLNRRFKLTFNQAGSSVPNGTCTWMGEDEAGESVFVVVRLAMLSEEELGSTVSIDPTMKDGAAEVGDILRDFAWADPVWELNATTFGPGTAFRKDSVIGQTNVFITQPEDLAQAAEDERQAELILAQNLSVRLVF